VIPVLEISPLVLTEEVCKGERVARRVRVTGLGADFDIASARVEGKGGLVGLEIGVPSSLRRANREFRTIPIEITLPAEAPLGELHQMIVLRTTSRERPHASLPVSISVVGDLRASGPIMLTRGMVPGASLSGSVWVSSRDGLPFLITSIDVEQESGALVEAEWKPRVAAGGIAYEVTLSAMATEKQGQVQGVLVVHTEHPGGEPLRIRYFEDHSEVRGVCGNDRYCRCGNERER
jgi:hypothetical protein